MTTDPWNKRGNLGDWSDQVEKEEAQRSTQLDGAAYPSLNQASKQKMKKKGGQSMSLGQFMTQDSESGSAYRPGVSRPQTDTEILMSLPKQPKQRDPNEEPPPRWSNKRGGFNREDRARRPQRDEEHVPSRADESNNWGTDKRSSYGGTRSYERPHSRGSNRGYEDRFEGDTWSSNKHASSGRSGFANFYDSDRDNSRRQGYGFHSTGFGGGGGGGGNMNSSGSGGFANNRGTEDKWSHSSSSQHQAHSTGGERKKLIIDKRTIPLAEHGQAPEVARAKQKSNPFGEARPREEVLRERGVDVTSSDVHSSRSDACSEQDFKSQSGSPGGSYRSSAVSGGDLTESSTVRKAKAKSEDPFGGARPREDVLNERGDENGSQHGHDDTSTFDHRNTTNPHEQLSQVEEIAQRIEAI